MHTLFDTRDLRTVLLGILLVASAAYAKADHIVDASRERKIPIEVYEPPENAGCTPSSPCPVAIISAGYGVTHTRYSFLARTYNQLGYAAIAVGHELPGDPPLSVSGNLFETRQENWQRGAKTLLVVRDHLGRTHPEFRLNDITLVGHSNGGDISALLAGKRFPFIRTVVTLDHRRVPLPRDHEVSVLSIRAGDFPADPGVLPTHEEQLQYGSCTVSLPKARHNDMSDDGPDWLKLRISNILVNFHNSAPGCGFTESGHDSL